MSCCLPRRRKPVQELNEKVSTLSGHPPGLTTPPRAAQRDTLGHFLNSTSGRPRLSVATLTDDDVGGEAGVYANGRMRESSTERERAIEEVMEGRDAARRLTSGSTRGRQPSSASRTHGTSPATTSSLSQSQRYRSNSQQPRSPLSGPSLSGRPDSDSQSLRRTIERELVQDEDTSAVAASMAEREGKLSVGIDFGTTFSGVAYGSTRLFSGQIRQILNWPGSYETYRKIPTCILYAQASPDDPARVIAWGLEAKNAALGPGLVKCEWFKLFLSPESLRAGSRDARLPPLPHGKEPVDVIVDFLRCIWTYAKATVTEEIGSVVDLNAADVILTVPAAWDAAGCALMRDAAIKAGLVQSARGGDVDWRDRLRIITEPEAAAIHASTLSSLHRLEPQQSFIICDAGGGTVDSAVYKLIGSLSALEIAELCVRSGATCGSLFVDIKFEELLRRLLKDHPQHLDPASMAMFMHAFSEIDKLAYHGTPADDALLFRFNCFNVEDNYDPEIGLDRGELVIAGHVLRREVFDPVIEEVLALLELQLAKIPDTKVDALILVGGFASSEYLFARVQQTFGSRIAVIARPNDCDVATLKGAARYGLGMIEGKAGVSSVISPRAYIMKVKLPAEPVDIQLRPGFIVRNDTGIEVCENRLSYLVSKGAVLKKGERLRSRFCKYTKGLSPADSVFDAVLYVSDSDQIFRYTDEGETSELCRWTVDLAALPAYARVAQRGGGYVEFDLGLEVDSAEVRGVLMTEEGVESGRATFEFINKLC